MPELIKDGEDSGDKKLGPKKNATFQKYKWWIVGGLAVVAALVYYFYRKNAAAAQSQSSTTNQPGIDPATGLPYASEYGGYGNFGGGGGSGSGNSSPPWWWWGKHGGGGGGGGGAGKVTVPSVIGLNRAESAAKLSSVGLVYKQANVVHGTAHATSESPPAGAKVNIGSTVTVTMTAQKGGGGGGGDGAGVSGTSIAGKAPHQFAFVPTPRISTVQKLTAGSGHTASSNKPGVAGIVPKVSQAA